MALLPKVFLCASLFLSSLACMGLCQETGANCVSKLLPCQKYLHATTPPPWTCCEPLKDLLATDSQCLCAILNNDALLKQFNVTKNDVLQLPRVCGAKANATLCKNSANGSPASAPPKTTTPPISGKGTSSPSNNKTSGASYGKILSSGAIALVGSVSLVIYPCILGSI